jgi:hypothetical protein
MGFKETFEPTPVRVAADLPKSFDELFWTSMDSPVLLYQGATVQAQQKHFGSVDEMMEFLRTQHQRKIKLGFHSITLSEYSILLRFAVFR